VGSPNPVGGDRRVGMAGHGKNFPEHLDSVIDRMIECVHERVDEAVAKGLRYENKNDGSRVTESDRAIEGDWRKLIHAEFPDHAILGEELGGSLVSSGYQWVVDPIDGTDDFSRGMPAFGYIIALLKDGIPVASAMGHPVLDIHLRAKKGQGVLVNGRSLERRALQNTRDVAIAMPSLEDFLRREDRSEVMLAIARAFPNFRVYRNLFGHTAVIQGSLEAGFEFDVAPWDFLATRLMIEETGQRFVVFRETENDGVRKSGVVFGRAEIVGRLCGVLSDHGYPC